MKHADSKSKDLHYRRSRFYWIDTYRPSNFRAEENHTTHIGSVGEARWTYAVSKLAAEHLTKAYHQEFDMPTVIIRPFNIYGPGHVSEGALKTFIKRALKNKEIVKDLC